jgi:hypothetical protein
MKIDKVTYRLLTTVTLLMAGWMAGFAVYSSYMGEMTDAYWGLAALVGCSTLLYRDWKRYTKDSE